MSRRLIRDESGMALGLAIIMIVLIGVMGAGLLVFVRNDLEAVVEVNRGQRAFDRADAGIQAGKRQLIVNAAPTHYNGVNNPSANPPDPESQWSYAGAGRTLSLGDCSDCINVRIQYLLPATTASQVGDPNYAPERVPAGQSDYPPGVDYFKITSVGTDGSARRKVEAIYVTQTSGVPQGYYTQGNIDLGGNLRIEGLSMFAMGAINYNGNPNMQGIDVAYGNWNRPPWNTTARPTNLPGFGAVGAVTGTGALNTRDFGSNSNPRFILKNPPDGSQSSNQITFPFDHRQQPNLESLRTAALSQNTANRSQGNYYEATCGTTASMREHSLVGTGPRWPANSTPDTVVYVRFNCGSFSSSSLLNWDVTTAGGDRKGTLVVENGRLEMPQHTACLDGIAVIRGVPADQTAYNAGGGNSCLKGYVNASGIIRIRGNISPSTQERGNRPGFYGMRLWSWRECYNEACN